MPEAFAAKYQVLVEIRNKLEKLSLTQAWSLRETDLYDYQRQLERIDESRVDGNFVDAEGNFAELYVQRVNMIAYSLSNSTKLTSLDAALSHSKKLWIHLLLDGFFGTRIRGTAPCLQPASNTEKMSY